MSGHVLVTGGAGFIGTNLTHALATDGEQVVVLDDLSRPGVRANATWLREQHDGMVRILQADVRDAAAVEEAVEGAKAVHHLAAQVAVTTSLDDPRHDFDVNLRGTLNVLEALRRLDGDVPLVFASTNKVYGCLDDLPLSRQGNRYVPSDPKLRRNGIGEDAPLDLRSPYGCSKGAADQYVLDYARSYGLPATALRMSCIYGPHQHGNEDQGWIAHFLRSAIAGRPVTIYGDGRQVRDVLFVADVVDAYRRAADAAPSLKGRAFNIGGGPGNTLSLLELVAWVRECTHHQLDVTFDEWRTGDQRYYVSDVSAFTRATGWRPAIHVDAGLQRLHRWLEAVHGAAPAATPGAPGAAPDRRKAVAGRGAP